MAPRSRRAGSVETRNEPRKSWSGGTEGSSLGLATLYYRHPGQAVSPLSARYADVTSEPDRFHKLRHDLSNPLSALLAETKLLLLNESKLDPETLTSLREIEALAVRMRGILRES